PLCTVIDTDLLGWETVWAAAGAPDAVFQIEPGALAEITNATRAAVS
ncbi:MAG: prolyl-tRNA editing enzyme YbaK/EbsC (Cys-tRNA(Pro) deacylase), partial [Acidimicrobiales bacterium]